MNIELIEDLTLAKGTTISVGEGQIVNFKVDSTIDCDSSAFTVDHGTLNIYGEGTIKVATKKTYPAVSASGSDAVINFNGATIDCYSENGSQGNYANGIYLLDGASVNFNSGTIKVGQGMGISTNNTTGGATEINVSGGEILSDGCYAIYSPAQEIINITGGKVQGINARIGKITISKTAEIIPTTITNETRDDIGANFDTSGCIWFGDTIALVTGTYEDPSGTDMLVDIKGTATVKSDFRSAIAVYAVDTKVAQNVAINIANSNNVTTTDTGFDAIKVYDHAAIEEAATAAGKTYHATVDSDITITAEGQIIYPVNE